AVSDTKKAIELDPALAKAYLRKGLVKEKIEFAVNQMNWPLEVVALFPQLLGYGMEKGLCLALIAKGLLGSELPSIPCVLAYTNEAFLKRYVMKHDDKQLVT
ncbi:hypothetical protein HID58_079727, partial [Brassica napus]